MLIRKFAVLAVFIFLSLSVHISYASDSLGIQSELSKPGVKLVAVDFFSINCKPCMKAMPKWAKVLKKYRKKGLRFITVSAEKKSICSDPGWSPDRELCDADFALQERFGVQGWPTYFLYSWDGNVNIVTHEVGAMENEIEAYFKEREFHLKIDDVEVIGDAIQSNPVWVQKLVEAEINRQSKFHIVSLSAKSISKQELGLCDDVMGANSILRIMLEGDLDGHRTATLTIEKDSCKKATIQENYQGGENERDNLKAAIKKAVPLLLQQIIKAHKPKQIGGQSEYYSNADQSDDWWVEGEELVVIKFKAKPDGSTVLVDGQILCKSTPCSESVLKGSHKVSIQKQKYLTKTKTINFTSDTTIEWNLTPNFGWLTVETDESGLEVLIDGKVAGKTPLASYELSPRRHKVEISSKCYFPASKTIRIKNDKREKWKPNIKARQGAIKVSSRDKKGNVVRAEVFLDGQYVGKSPGKFKASVCAGLIEIRAKGYDSFKKQISVKEKKTLKVDIVLEYGGKNSAEEKVYSFAKNLIWQVNSSKKKSWVSAKKYCSRLKYGGYSDWRLPNKSELQSLLTEEKYDGCYCPSSIKGKCGWFWSSTSYSNNNFDAWRVDFYNHFVGYSKKYYQSMARCVRSRQGEED